jgi:hypothetical protein
MPSGKSFTLPVFSEKFWLHPPAHPPAQDITRPPAETEQCHQENLSLCQSSVRSSGYTLQPIHLTGISPAPRLKLSNAIRQIFHFASIQ